MVLHRPVADGLRDRDERAAELGLILPKLTGILPILTPLAGTGLAIIMVGAVVVHLRRKESATPSLVLALLAIVSAVLAFITL